MIRQDRVLVIGASGLLGSRLLELIPSSQTTGTHYSRPGKHTVFCDLADKTSVHDVIKHSQPGTILHVGGITRPDACEEAKARAWLVNVGGIEHILSADPEAKIVFFSTDYVFDGQGELYSEQERTNPINEYGRTKLAAEQILLKKRPDALVLRTAGLFGYSQSNGEFLDSLSGTSVKCSRDHFSSYTFLDDVYRLLPELLERDGVVHFVGPDVFSREEFARLACRKLNAPTIVLGVAGADAFDGAPRPRNSSMKSIRYHGRFTSTVAALELLGRRLQFERSYRTSPNG